MATSVVVLVGAAKQWLPDLKALAQKLKVNAGSEAGTAGYATKDSDPALLLTAIRKVAAGGRYIDPDLADRMVFEVGLTDTRPLHSLLSEREFSVFERLAQGANVNDIAQQLALSSKTISTHKARLMQKLNITSLAELVKYAMEHKLL